MASLGISDKLFWTITFRKYKNVWFFFFFFFGEIDSHDLCCPLLV